jgi:hypothetical protein
MKNYFLKQIKIMIFLFHSFKVTFKMFSKYYCLIQILNQLINFRYYFQNFLNFHCNSLIKLNLIILIKKKNLNSIIF